MESIARTLFCRKCGTEKPEDAFGVVVSNKTGRRSVCRECWNQRRRAWRSYSKAKVSDQKRRYWRAHRKEITARNHGRPVKERRRDARLRCLFGISLDDFNQMVADQGGKCAICGERPSEHNGHRHKKNLHVDHDHATGKVRGLLCNSCNTAIGSFRDNPELLTKAIEYLELHRNKPDGDSAQV